MRERLGKRPAIKGIKMKKDVRNLGVGFALHTRRKKEDHAGEAMAGRKRKNDKGVQVGST